MTMRGVRGLGDFLGAGGYGGDFLGWRTIRRGFGLGGCMGSGIGRVQGECKFEGVDMCEE